MRIGLLFIFLIGISCQQEDGMPSTQTNYQDLRNEMVERQIKSRGVKDSLIIDAIRKVPRHLFVPERFRARAYTDSPLPIGSEQTISQPYIVAFMSEQLQLQPGDRVLEIGTGSGYQAAVLSLIADSVFTIEIIPELARKAAQTLRELKYDNIVVQQGDGYHGWQDKAPFDAIMVTAAPPRIPPLLLEQLKIGGRMVVPVGEYVQELVVVNKTARGMEMQNVLPVRFVPMTGEIRK